MPDTVLQPGEDPSERIAHTHAYMEEEICVLSGYAGQAIKGYMQAASYERTTHFRPLSF